MPTTLGGGRSRKGMGLPEDLWPQRGLGLSCGTPVLSSTFWVEPEAADLNWTIQAHRDGKNKAAEREAEKFEGSSFEL